MWAVLAVVLLVLIIVIYYSVAGSSRPKRETYHENPFIGGKLVQVNASGGDIITGVCLGADRYQLYYTWNGKTMDVDWVVCGLPPDTWEFILFPHRAASLITYYSKDRELRCAMVNQARFIRRGSFGHYLYVFQNYMGMTHMRRVTPISYILMGKPPAVDLYMGMAPPIHPLKPTYDVLPCPNPPNIAGRCRLACIAAEKAVETTDKVAPAATSAPTPSPAAEGEAAKESCCGM